MNGFADALAGLAALLGVGAAPPGPIAHGYVEGEYLRLAAPVAANLERLDVARGQWVKAGAPLFTLDLTQQRAERDRLAATLNQARSQLADLEKGKRPEEIAVIEAQRAQAEAQLAASQSDLRRQEDLARASATSQHTLQTARSIFDRDRAHLVELVAALEVARLAARPDLLRAARDSVEIAQAALAQQDRRLVEMAPLAPAAGLIEDTLYNVGEWVPAGMPVISLLPPDRLKVVAYVAETLVGGIRPGLRLTISCDRCPAGLSARVAFVSSRAEYTPPVIYSVGSREKLVFRVEAKIETGSLEKGAEAPTPTLPLNPGLPVDISWPAAEARP